MVRSNGEQVSAP